MASAPRSTSFRRDESPKCLCFPVYQVNLNVCGPKIFKLPTCFIALRKSQFHSVAEAALTTPTKMTELLSPSESPGGHKPDGVARAFACTRCQLRKVKCDRADTCANCVKGKNDCVYVAPPPSQRRKRKAPVEAELLDKLEHYEKLLKSRGIDLNAALKDVPDKTVEKPTAQLRKQKDSTTKVAHQGNPAHGPDSGPAIVLWEFRNGRMIAENDGWIYVEEFFWASDISEEVL